MMGCGCCQMISGLIAEGLSAPSGPVILGQRTPAIPLLAGPPPRRLPDRPVPGEAALQQAGPPPQREVAGVPVVHFEVELAVPAVAREAGLLRRKRPRALDRREVLREHDAPFQLGGAQVPAPGQLEAAALLPEPLPSDRRSPTPPRGSRGRVAGSRPGENSTTSERRGAPGEGATRNVCSPSRRTAALSPRWMQAGVPRRVEGAADHDQPPPRRCSCRNDVPRAGPSSTRSSRASRRGRPAPRRAPGSRRPVIRRGWRSRRATGGST